MLLNVRDLCVGVVSSEDLGIDNQLPGADRRTTELENGLDDHGFSGLRLRTARERDASRALPQCVATVPLKASRGTTSCYMPVQPRGESTPVCGLCASAPEQLSRA
jgi:hypothetical protein